MAENKIKKSDISEEDVFGLVGKSAEKNLLILDKFDQQLIEIADHLEKMFKKSGTSSLSEINNLVTVSKEMNKVTNDAVKIGKTRVEQQNAIKKSTQALTVEQQKQKEVLRQANLESKQIAKLKLAEKDSIEALRAKLGLVTTAWTKLTKEETENTKRGKRLTESKKQLTDQLKKLESATGDNRRNVGNYSSALDGLKGKFKGLIGIASQFGLALGGVAIVKGSIDTIKEFGQSIADLQAITGASGADLDKYKQQAIEMGKTTQGGAKAVVEAYKLIGSAKPELLANADSLIAVTDAARTLAKASGMELPEAATALTDAMNQFGAPAKDATKFINALAAGSKFGAAEIPQVTEAMVKFGAAAKMSNVSVEESTALIETLAEKGLKGAEAGTAIRNVMLKLSSPETLPKEAVAMMEKLGINFADITDKSKPFSERLDALKPLLKDSGALMKVFGTENAIAATNLLTSTDRIKELNAQVSNTDTAFEQAATRSKTLGEAFNTLTETWNSWVLSVTDGIGASEGLSAALDFLSTNMGTILKVLGQVVKMWIYYKGVLLAMKMKDRVSEYIKFNKAVKDGSATAKDASTSAKGLGQAFKAIGLAAFIALAQEAVMQFWDIASGAEGARNKIKLFNDQIAQGSAWADKTTGKYKEAMALELQNLEVRKSSTKMSNEQYLNEKSNITDLYNTKVKVIRDMAVVELKEAKAQMKRLEAGYKLEKEKNPFFQDIRIISKYESARGAYLDLGKEIQGYNAFLKESHDTQIDNIISLNESAKGVRENKKAVEEHEKYVRKDTEALERNSEALSGLFDPEEMERILNLDRERKVVMSDIRILEAEIALEKANQVGSNDDILKAEKELQKAQEEGIRAKLKYDLDQEFDPAKQMQLQKQAELDILKLYNEKETDETKKHSKEIKELFDKYGEEIIDGFIDRSKRREDILNKELDASKKQEDALRELANNGNADAKDSLAAQENVTKEKTRLADAEARKQAQLEELKIVYKAISDFMDKGDTLPSATVKGIAGTFGIRKLIAALPAFFKGTEDTGSGGGVDNKGGFLSVLHPNERVVPKKLNTQLDGATNEDLVNGYLKFKDMNNGLLVKERSVSHIDGISFEPLTKKIDELASVMKNKKEIHFSEKVKMGISRGLVVTEKQGLTRTRTHYKG